MGPRAPRSSHPSSPRAAHEGSKLIFDSSSRSRVSIARASHQRPRSLQTRASRREAPKLRMDRRPRAPRVTRTALHCDSTGDRGGGGRRPWGPTDVALPPRACAFDGRGPTSHKYIITEPPHQRGVHPVMAVGCQTGAVERGRHISAAGQWPEVPGGLRTPIKAPCFLPRRPTRGLRCSRRPYLLADSRCLYHHLKRRPLFAV